MADESQDEQLVNPTNTPPESPPEKNISAPNTTPIPPIQLPESMEVHHHAHDPAAPHHKKNWKSYFWEFLMLFLAVFCGFLAEYQLEHKIEQDRAEEFAASMLQDLKTDTATIALYIKTGKIYNSSADSLFKISKSPLEGYNASRFSFYTRFMYWTGPLNWSRATFEQIKSSGSLRYFKNHELLQKLIQYNAMINANEGEFANRMVRGNMMLNQINQIIDPVIHHDLSRYRLYDLDSMSTETMGVYFSRNLESLETKRAAIRELLNMCIVQQRNIEFNNNERLLPANNLAKELIADFKKEYHLE